MFIYETGPIDNWVGITPIEDYVGTLDWYDRDERAALFNFLFEALWLARDHAHWEGDAHQVHVSGLPPEDGECTSTLIIGWKQSNNGTSFIASEMPLPHLKGAQVYPKARIIQAPAWG